MNASQIFFAHANGFPARTYTKLFSFLEDEFEIGFIEKFGHDPNFPVTDGWTFLKDEIKNAIQKQNSAPVIGIGHSLGGILHLLAAARNLRTNNFARRSRHQPFQQSQFARLKNYEINRPLFAGADDAFPAHALEN